MLLFMVANSKISLEVVLQVCYTITDILYISVL